MYDKKRIGQAVILCGGYGTRLSEITNNKIHKSIIQIGNFPFIYYILHQIYLLKIKRVVFCVGVLSDTIIKQMTIFQKKNPNIFNFEYSIESVPLGTAGALINTHNKLIDDYSLIINGDTYVNDNLSKFINNKFNFDILMLTSFKFLTNKYGAVVCNNELDLVGFKEKKLSLFNYVYSGIAIFKNDIFKTNLTKKVINVEDFYFNDLNYSTKIIKSKSKFIDIGTKKRYLRNEKFFSSLKLPFVL